LLFSQDGVILALFMIAAVARGFAWLRYRAAVSNVALEPAGRTLIRVGTIVALACAVAGIYAAPFAWLAALAAVASGWQLKFLLVVRASSYEGLRLPHLPVRGSR
jgi:hypothetical protein